MPFVVCLAESCKWIWRDSAEEYWRQQSSCE